MGAEEPPWLRCALQDWIATSSAVSIPWHPLRLLVISINL
jgi:hypothetical protein